MRAIAAGCLVWAACGPAVSSTTIHRRQVATDGARVTGYFATPSDAHFEVTPDGVPRQALLDEAVLVRAEPGETCIDLTLRSAHDHAVDEYPVTLAIDGEPARPAIADERAVTYEYLLAGGRRRLPDDAPACDWSCREDRGVFLVTERTARLCSSLARAARKVELRLIHPSLTYRAAGTVRRYQLLLEWNLEG